MTGRARAPALVESSYRFDLTAGGPYLQPCDLAHEHRRVGDIALDTGFSDISNFNRAFRQRHGIPPTEAWSGALNRKRR